MIITVGATGSGKSALAKAAAQQVGARNLERFLIDDDVEHDPAYVKRVETILKDVGPEALNDPTPELLERFHRAYWEVRTRQGCAKARDRLTRRLTGPPSPTSPDILHLGGGCDMPFDYRLTDALKSGRDILFETTGLYYPSWLIEATRGRYRVVLAYTLVSITQLLRRNKSRAYDDAVAFLQDPAVGAPRLPDLDPERFRSGVEKMQRGLQEVKQHRCWEDGNDAYCGNVPIDELLVYDNDGASIRLMSTFKK